MADLVRWLHDGIGSVLPRILSQRILMRDWPKQKAFCAGVDHGVE